MIDESAEMLGPFWRPLRSDWAWWAFCIAVAIDLAIRLPHTWASADGAIGTVAFRVALGAPFEVLGILVLFAVVIGIPRGFLLGARGGRRVGRRAAPPAS